MQLYELIHSMSKAEKRYFKLYAQIGSKKGQIPKYIALFNLLNSQTKYDEKAVKKKGFGADVKKFLYEKILEALHIFQLRKSPDEELRMLLSQISILFKKELWEQMRSRLKKARQLAEGNERFLILLEILEWEQELTSKSVDTNQVEQQKNIISEKQMVQKKYLEENKYEDLATEIYMIQRKDSLFNHPENGQRIKQLYNTPLLGKDATFPSVKAKIHYHQLNYIFSKYSSQANKVEKHLKAIINAAQENKFLFYMRDFAVFYMRTLFQYSRFVDNREYKNIYKTISNFPFQSLDITYAIRSESLNEYIQQLNEYEGKHIIKQMENDWNKYERVSLKNKLNYFSYRASIFYSIFGYWDKAQKWLDKTLELNRASPTIDFSIFARLWQLVIAFENTPEELDKYIQSSYKYLNRHNCYHETERQVIQLFKGLYKAIDHNERKIIWQNLYDFLDTKIKNKKNTTFLQKGLPELQIWCQSKINRTTMAEIMRQN